MTLTRDVIVIGGGIAGVAAAAEIAAEARVTLLEAEPVLGYHSTGRSAAIFLLNYGNATLRALNAASEPVLGAPEGISETSLLSPRGELLVAEEDETDALEAYLADAEGMDRLTPAEAAEIVPILRADRIAAAAIERSARDIDVDRYLQGVTRLLRRRGGEIRTGHAVRTIRREGPDWRVETAEAAMLAPILVNAAGAWADDLARAAGVAPIGLTPCRRSAAILPAPDGHQVAGWPLFGSASERWYAKPDAGKLMVSPADEDPVDPHDAWADDMVLAEGLDRYERAVTVPVTRVERSWAGLRSFTPDRSPVAGFAADAPGFLWLAGQGGYGVQTAPALARLAADLCLGHAPALPGALCRSLQPGRFSAPPIGQA